MNSPGASFTVAVLNEQHDRSGFSCGKESLDRYLRQQAGQDMRRRVTICYAATDNETQRVAGYYTLSASSMLLTEVPAPFGKKLPRYPDVPVARLGRLAVDERYRGRSLGSALLWDAMDRSARSEVAVHALLVDAKDDEASAFYAHHGFVALDVERRRMMLPVATIKQA